MNTVTQRLTGRTIAQFTAILMLLVFAFASSLKAQDLDVPPTLQAAIFKKVFAYVKIGTPKVTIVHSAAGTKSKDDLMTQFKNVGLEVDAIEEANAAKAAGNVVYLVPGVGAGSAKKVGKKFIITCSKDFITDGLAMMAIVNAGGKPSLLANTTAIGGAGIEVDPQLFRIASQVK
ncbi:MAG: nascent polypeptide-associated complex subunit family protein [Candidatus Kapabacteria bacterium]|jgi:hypothetical protein|nr:nascent polypeptide-associated complex subunit family protein [Candidatus Kapabacteria bacterium]